MTSWSNRLGATLFVAGLATGCATTSESTKPAKPEKPDIVVGGVTPVKPVSEGEGVELNADERRTLITAMYLNAVGYFDRGDYDTALAELLRVVELDPNHREAHFKIALIFYKKERYAEEILALERAVKADYDYLLGHLNLAHACLAQEQLDRALKHYREVLRLDPRHPLAHYNAGLINIDLSRWLIALEHLERAQENQHLLGPTAQEKIKMYIERCKARLGK